MDSKYCSASELKAKILEEKRLPRTANQKGRRYSFIAKIRGSIYGKFNKTTFTLR